jgi:nuclear receptor interaction protein
MKEGTNLDFEFVDKAFDGMPVENTVDVEEASAEVYAPLLQSVIDVVEEEDEDVVMSDDEPEEVGEDSDEDDDDDEDVTSEADGDEEIEGEDDDDFWARRRRRRRGYVETQAPVWEHTKVYKGHCKLLILMYGPLMSNTSSPGNVRTIKDINFYGMDDEYVISGSDCGHLFFCINTLCLNLY